MANEAGGYGRGGGSIAPWSSDTGSYLEQKQYAPTTINLRLAAVRRVAYEAADSGLLSPELAAGIRRVKGIRRMEPVSGTGSR